MSDRQAGEHPSGTANSADREPAPSGGFRGEQAAAEDAYEHVVLADNRPVLVAETSGVAFVEARDASGATASPPPSRPARIAPASSEDVAGPAPAPSIASATLVGFALGALLGWSWRRSRETTTLLVVETESPPAAASLFAQAEPIPAAFASPVAPAEAFIHTRDAGPELIRDEDGANWDVVDEGLDETFPASDPPSFSPPGR